MLDDADDDITEPIESLLQESEGDALAGAGVAGDHHVAAVGDAEFDTAQERVKGRRDVDRLDRHVGTERMELQSIGLQQGSSHCSPSLMSRVVTFLALSSSVAMGFGM